MSTRRGRGFNPKEVANLRSWGVEPRPDEIEPAIPQVLLPTPVNPEDPVWGAFRAFAAAPTPLRAAIFRQLKGLQASRPRGDR